MLNGYLQIVRNFLTLAGDLSMQYSVESLKDQVAIVTGGASGIGRAMVLALLKVGAYVIVPDNNEQAIIELKAMASSDKLRCSLIDLGQREAGPAVINLALNEFKKIDILINNAGVGRHLIKDDVFFNPPRFWDASPQMWEKFIAINTNAPFFLMHATVPHMIEQGYGRIINVTTSLDSMLRGGMSPYGPTKAAAEALASVAANDLKGTGVTVNIIVPGGTTDTNMIPDHVPIDRSSLLRPEVMVPPLLWLLSSHGDNTTGMRFRANLWDPDVSVEQAIATSGASIGWMEMAQGQMLNLVKIKS